MSPSWYHTGTPAGFDGFLHFTSSTTAGSACLMRVRSQESVSPRQSPSSLILASINSDGDPGFCGAAFFTTSLSPDGSSQLLDADQVARGIAEGAVANPVRLLG